jgi:hypothetical protein
MISSECEAIACPRSLPLNFWPEQRQDNGQLQRGIPKCWNGSLTVLGSRLFTWPSLKSTFEAKILLPQTHCSWQLASCASDTGWWARPKLPPK